METIEEKKLDGKNSDKYPDIRFHIEDNDNITSSLH